jgi:membrane-bound lytic murein transglycosylase MltF
MGLNEKQIKTKQNIERLASFFGLDPAWPVAVAMVESSLGLNQKSPTGCRGVFQMSGVAMKDLLQEMEKRDDDLIDIACGVAFLSLLLRRWGTINDATAHFCDPNDRNFYVAQVLKYMRGL